MRRPRLLRLLPLCAILLGAPFSLDAQESTAICPDPRSLVGAKRQPFAAVRYLADERLAGRERGSLGEACARAYVAAEFRRIGLRPAGDSTTFFQWVPVPGPSSVRTANVVGLLPGADPALRGEAIVVGAHHDHLGRRGRDTAADPVYPGADDNASGVAALLRAAEILTAGPRPARTVVFVTFTAEEAMMLGSNHFVSHPPLPLAGVRAMLNLDMVGRVEEQPLLVSGTGSSPLWPDVLGGAAVPGLRWELRPEVEKGSDHLPFSRSGIPVLYLHNGPHPDYHQPTDTWNRVQLSGVERVAQLVARVVTSLSTPQDP